jgi:catechol 2,3-dioxygenase-like lactoylglutathione lyase family enzyme
MLRSKNAVATVPVKNIDNAKKFYEGKLGLKPVHNEMGKAIEYKAGDTELLVYESQFAGSNRATAVTWMVDQVENEVKDLKTKGITFEHYKLPGVTMKGDVHEFGDLKNAWFKDPDGNIHSLVSH